MGLSKAAKKIIRQATYSNVIICDGYDMISDALPKAYEELWELTDEAFNNPQFAWRGKTCHHCNKRIEFMDGEELIFTYNSTTYTLIFSKALSSIDDWTEEEGPYGYLECSYCLNQFHHLPCTLRMSPKTYLHHKKNKSWICPSCIPEYLPTTHLSTRPHDLSNLDVSCEETMTNHKKKKSTTANNPDDTLIQLFTVLNYIMQNVMEYNVHDFMNSVSHHAVNLYQIFEIG